MSRIYFNTHDDEAQVYGSERAWLGALVRNITWGTAEPYVGETFKPDLVALAVNFNALDEVEAEMDPFRKRMLTKQRFETWLAGGDVFGKDTGLKIGDNVVPTGELSLNTAMAVGNDAIKLAAKIHGTCEDFAWVAPEHQAWFAQIIEAARTANIFRANAGWEDVITLASKNNDGPIVLSYSVSDDFPSAYAADWQAPECVPCGGSGDPNPDMEFTDVDYDYCTSCGGDGRLHDAWYDLSSDERWKLSVEGIAKREHTREISPEALPVPFLYGETLFDVISKAVHDIPPSG